MSRAKFIGGWVALAALGAGCHEIKPPVSAATLKAAELPSDVAALQAKEEEVFNPRDPIALENTQVICERILALDPKNYDAAWEWARAAFWLADAAGGSDNKDRRAWFSDKGSKYAAQAIAIDGKRVEGHYYRGLTLGYLARTRTIGALELVKDIHKEALAAVEIDEKYDHAGPLRLLGGVLINAPGWPTSVGDPDEGAERLAKAVELAPEYPLNHFFYGEALLKNDKAAEAEKEILAAIEQMKQPEYSWMAPRLQAEIDEQLKKARDKQGK